MAPWVYSFSIALFLGQTAIPLNAHAHDVANALSPFYSNSRKYGTTSHATEKVGTTTEQGFTGLFIVDGFPVQVLDGFFSIDNGTPNDPTNDIYGVVTQSGAITLNDGTRLQLSDFSSVERHLIGGPSGFIDVPGLGAIPVVNGTLNLAMVGLPGASGKIDLAGYYEVTLADGTIIQNSLTRQAEFTTRYFASGPTGSVTLGGNPPVQVFVTNGFFRLPSGETGYLQNTLDYLLENGDTGNLDSIPEITYTFPDLPEMTIHFSDGSSTQVRNGFFLLDGIPGRVIKSGEGFLFIHTDASGNHTEKSVFDLNEVTKVDCGANVSHTMCGIDLTESNPPIPTPSTPSTPSSPSNTAPTLSAIANQSIAKNSNSGALAVTTGDSETAVGSLIVSASSSNTTLIPNGNLVWGGTGASRTLTATPAVGQTGTATITYSVSDGSLTTSKTFDVSVAGTAPAFASIANQTGTVGSAFSLALSSYITATNGDSVDSYRISAGTLPSGLSLNTSSGLVSGTPLSAEGPVSVSFQAHDADGWSNTVPVQFVINTDTTPDTFAFTDVTNQTVSTLIESNAITVSGINAAANISVTGGEYQINGGTWASSAGTVTAGQTVKVRHTTSASNSTTTDTTLTIGGVSDTFTTTTVAASDTAPDAFDIPNMTNQALSTAVTTNAITVAGINTSITASTNVGTIVKNGVDTGSASTTVNAGDTVAVKLTTSGSNSTAVNGTLTIGTVSDSFSVTTMAASDTTPDAFTFTDVTSQTTSTVVESNAITVAGINTATAISVTGGEYQINGGAWTSSAGTVNNGQTVKVRHTTSASNSTTTNTVLTIGGVSDTFTTMTIAAANTVPTLSDVGNQNVAKNGTSGALAVTIGDAETAVASLAVSASSSNTTLIPNANLVWGGAGANRTLTITPATNQTGTATITYDVSDGSGGVTSKTFNVTVAGSAPAMGDVPNQTGTPAAAFSLALSDYVTQTNGDAITGYRIASGSLPAGLSLNIGTGAISGTPTVLGTSNITVEAQDNDGWSASDAIQFVIGSPAAPSIVVTDAFTDAGSGTRYFDFSTIDIVGASYMVDVSLDESDASVAAGWYVNTSSSAPSAAVFSPSLPQATFPTGTSDGQITFFAWLISGGYISDMASTTVTIDRLAPSLTSDSLNLSDIGMGTGTGSISFSEMIGEVVSVEFVDGFDDTTPVGGSISYQSGIGTSTLSFSYDLGSCTRAPGDDIKVKITLKDLAHNTATLLSGAYTLGGGI